MGYIICATRGGQGSRALRTQAIATAHETGNPLLFLFVVDLSQFGHFDDSLRAAFREETEFLGHVLLEIARIQATGAGISVELLVREGKIKEEIVRCVKEKDAGMIMLGAPRGTTANAFGDDAIEQFANQLHSETGIPVQIARPEDWG